MVGLRGGCRLLQPQPVKQQKQLEGWQLILWAVTNPPACTSEHHQCGTGPWIHLHISGAVAAKAHWGESSRGTKTLFAEPGETVVLPVPAPVFSDSISMCLSSVRV